MDALADAHLEQRESERIGVGARMERACEWDDIRIRSQGLRCLIGPRADALLQLAEQLTDRRDRRRLVSRLA